MTYREDRDAIEQNLAGLRATLDALRTTDLDPVTAEARTVALETEICRLEARLNNAPPAPPLLRRLKVISPCDQSWDQMRGTNAVRHCESCDKDVYNIEQMTMPEVEAMVVATGGKPCVRLMLRSDGLIVTSECLRAEQDRRLKRHVRVAAVAVVAAILAGSALVAWKKTTTSVQHTGAADCSSEITQL